MLELRDVTKSYNGKVILQPTSLTVEPGATTVLIGPSGCGKSTLLRMMVGLVTPDSGSVWIAGTQMTPATALQLRTRIGYVIQDGGLFPHLSARDNVALMAQYTGWDAARCEARVNELAVLVRLPADLLDRFPSQMSGGQRQRVGIMRALMLDPSVLLFDEPRGALDPLVRAELQEDLRNIFQRLNKVVVMVTHDMGEAGFFGKRILLLGDGRVLQAGTLNDLIRSPADDFVQRFINAQRIPGGIHMSRLLALALLLSPSLVWAGPVVVGSKNYTEQVILGEALCRLLDSRGIPARHEKALDGTQIIFKALKGETVDVYVEYTGTLKELFQDDGLRGEEEIRSKLAKLGITLGDHLGFANNWALGVRGQLADKEGIKKISDLKEKPKLRLGFSTEFLQRKDGWDAVKRTYGLEQKPEEGVGHQQAVTGLRSGALDVTDIYTTDPEIKSYNLRVLEDDIGALKIYEARLMWRSDLDERHPGAVAALRKLEGQITTEEMVEMNNRVREDSLTEFEAAAEFLHNKLGLEKPPPGPSFANRLFRSILTMTWQHLLLVVVSLGFAIAIAVPLGILAYRRPRLGKYVLGLVSVIQTIPSMALLVFLIPFLGLGTWPALVALFMYSLLPIVRNTCTGLNEISPALREAAEVLGLPPRARLWRIELPLASRSILSGIKTAAVINVGTATIGAIIGAGGYGQSILTGIRLDNIWIILAGAVPAALMALAVQELFTVLEPCIVPRGLRVA